MRGITIIARPDMRELASEYASGRAQVIDIASAELSPEASEYA